MHVLNELQFRSYKSGLNWIKLCATISVWIQQRSSVSIDTMECIRFVEDSFIEDTIYPNRCFFFTHASQGIIGKVLAQWQRDEMKGNMQLWRTKPHSLLWIVPLWSGWTHTEHSQGLIYLHLHQVHNSHLLFKTWVYCLENCSHEKTCICIDIKTWLWLMFSMWRLYIPHSNSANCIWCSCFSAAFPWLNVFMVT